MTARYWIAQHVPDLFRREVRNVGVFVERGNKVAARFFGETAPGEIDGRKLRGWTYPGAYRQWIEFWRGELWKRDLDSILRHTQDHYQVVEGGQVDSTEDDPLEDVSAHLYSLIVSEGGFAEAMALGGEEEWPSEMSLAAAVSATFRDQDLLGGTELFVPHPIMKSQVVKGATNLEHRVTFSQYNGNLCVMEPIDFTRQRTRARDRAGWCAYVFHDLREKYLEHLEAVAIVSVEEADRNREEVKAGLAVLDREGKIVEWGDDAQRESLIRQRKVAAG